MSSAATPGSAAPTQKHIYSLTVCLLGVISNARPVPSATFVTVEDGNCVLFTETVTALFKTNFRLDFPFDVEEFLAFALIG